MHWLILAICLCIAGIQTTEINQDKISNEVKQSNEEKGILEWLTGLFGPTTSKPIVNDPPILSIECPACQCGVAYTKRRIVGGHETLVRQYPWMVMLLYNGRMFCGGSLINDLYVMTAAHCSGFRRERMSVRFLEHDMTGHRNLTKTIDRKVASIIRHWRYNPGTYDNDIALLKLDERIDLSHAIKKRAGSVEEARTEAATASGPDAPVTSPATPIPVTTDKPEDEDVYVRPVCLATPGVTYTSECGLVTGWGVTQQGGSISNVLQEVKVPIVSNKECSTRSYGNRVTDNMLCAGEPDGGRDACQGDSGGPLHVFNETSGRYHEVGVVSWGEGCALPSKYGVYSRVNRYLTWIKSNTADACYCDPY